HLGLFLVDDEQVVAGSAVVGDGLLAVFGAVVAVVAPEASGVAHVPDVVGMRAPGDLHLGEYIVREDADEACPGELDVVCLCGVHVGMLGAVEVFEGGGDFLLGFGGAGVVGLEQLGPLFVDPRQIGIDGPVG